MQERKYKTIVIIDTDPERRERYHEWFRQDTELKEFPVKSFGNYQEAGTWLEWNKAGLLIVDEGKAISSSDGAIVHPLWSEGTTWAAAFGVLYKDMEMVYVYHADRDRREPGLPTNADAIMRYSENTQEELLAYARKWLVEAEKTFAGGLRLAQAESKVQGPVDYTASGKDEKKSR